MYSVIVSVRDMTKFEEVLLPSLNCVKYYLCNKNLPNIQIIVVQGIESITKNYNEGLRQATYPIKFFIHDDIDLMDKDVPLFVRIEDLFRRFPNTGLIGLAGTIGFPNGWWWDSPKELQVGHVYMDGNIKEYWKYNIEKPFYSDVNFIDGIFMATPLNIRFSEDIAGFHLYDSDYCNVIRKQGYDIKTITHLVRHHWIKKEISTDFTYYRQKWRL
jgi:hypothetical protein